MKYMDSRLGAWQVGDDQNQGAIEFNLFFPSGANPHITSIAVAGSFQTVLGQPAWDFHVAPTLHQVSHAEGTIWTYTTPDPLPAGFYEYKYVVTFDNGEVRWVSDPCTRYGGSDNQNAAIAIGGSWPAITPLAGGRKPLRELIVYELHLDDFTAEFRRTRAPLDAAVDKLDYLHDLGINAILVMPWTTWQNEDFDWGYTPFQYFAVEHRYANDPLQPAEKLSALRAFISACHARGIHVIMDGVFNHVHPDFPYRHLYLNRDDCPFTAEPFGGTFAQLQDLDFYNSCTQDLIRDVCLYWIDTFGVDGIRFDNTVNYLVPNDLRGIPDVLSDIQTHLDARGITNFSLTLEHIDVSAASVVNSTRATSYWDNALYGECFDDLWNDRLKPSFLNALNNQRFLNDPAKAPTLYLSNHDHSQVAWQAGARATDGAFEWYRTQPWAIALLTAVGVPMLQAGQEMAEDYRIIEDDHGTGRRVRARPLHWALTDDPIGRTLRNVYAHLIALRARYAGLRSTNFYPSPWDEWQTQLNPAGFGVDCDRGIAVYHRWDTIDGVLQRFYVVLNFTGTTQTVRVPVPLDGPWHDLLADPDGSVTLTASGNHLDVQVPSHWGHVLFRAG